MDGSGLLASGCFSSLCVLHRGLGSDDEEAGLQERAERLLYFFPRAVPLAAQLKHAGLCEGLLDFARGLAPAGAPPSTEQALTLHKRRFAMVCVEPPHVWMVLVLVQQQLAPASFRGRTDYEPNAFGQPVPSRRSPGAGTGASAHQ